MARPTPGGSGNRTLPPRGEPAWLPEEQTVSEAAPWPGQGERQETGGAGEGGEGGRASSPLGLRGAPEELKTC